MAKLVLPGCVLIRLIWTRGGEDTAVNVIGAENPGSEPVDQALATALGTAIKASFVSSVQVNNVPTNWALARITIRNIDVEDQAEIPSVGAPQAGANVNHSLPPQVALCVTLRTAKAGPSFRGRVYIPGWSEDTNDVNGFCLAAAAEQARLFVDNIKDDLGANGLTMAVLSRPRDAQPLAVPPVLAYAGQSTPVTSVDMRNLVWDTQRRRSVPGI